MKYIFLLKKTLTLALVMVLFSCVSKKDIVYYQNIDNLQSNEKPISYEITIQPDDLLSINVSAEDPETVLPFTINASDKVGGGAKDGSTYLVDVNGYINFPVLGKLKVSGLTRTQLLQLFQDKLSTYVKNPIVIIRVLNFKISVQGEVGANGIFPITSERITLIEAISMAGDLTIFGKRDNILIIREVGGVKSYNRVDITKADFINSPFYYLAQNDVVYVEPGKNKINSAKINPSVGMYFGFFSMLLTVITFGITILK
jgi:polysaccharide export outer membrane protein